MVKPARMIQRGGFAGFDLPRKLLTLSLRARGGRESMARNILILGASYGSLLATKLLMAGHNVTLVCRKKTAELINRDGTEVRIKLRDEAVHRAIFSRNLPG